MSTVPFDPLTESAPGRAVSRMLLASERNFVLGEAGVLDDGSVYQDFTAGNRSWRLLQPLFSYDDDQALMLLYDGGRFFVAGEYHNERWWFSSEHLDELSDAGLLVPGGGSETIALAA